MTETGEKNRYLKMFIIIVNFRLVNIKKLFKFGFGISNFFVSGCSYLDMRGELSPLARGEFFLLKFQKFFTKIEKS